MSKFEIDFFELLFLAEVCIPPVPIARNAFFESLSDIHYHKMSDQYRLKMFEFIIKNDKFDIKNEYCQHFYNRFNPDNQYNVETNFNGGKQIVKAYIHEGEYHVSKNRVIYPDFIVNVEKIPYTHD